MWKPKATRANGLANYRAVEAWSFCQASLGIAVGFHFVCGPFTLHRCGGEALLSMLRVYLSVAAQNISESLFLFSNLYLSRRF